jgi:hypothetical protein
VTERSSFVAGGVNASVRYFEEQALSSKASATEINIVTEFSAKAEGGARPRASIFE